MWRSLSIIHTLSTQKAHAIDNLRRVSLPAHCMIVNLTGRSLRARERHLSSARAQHRRRIRTILVVVMVTSPNALRFILSRAVASRATRSCWCCAEIRRAYMQPIQIIQALLAAQVKRRSDAVPMTVAARAKRSKRRRYRIHATHATLIDRSQIRVARRVIVYLKTVFRCCTPRLYRDHFHHAHVLQCCAFL